MLSNMELQKKLNYFAIPGHESYITFWSCALVALHYAFDDFSIKNLITVCFSSAAADSGRFFRRMCYKTIA